MYTVFMVNFNMEKGSFPTLEEAIAYAKTLGFECVVFRGNDLMACVKTI